MCLKVLGWVTSWERLVRTEPGWTWWPLRAWQVLGVWADIWCHVTEKAFRFWNLKHGWNIQASDSNPAQEAVSLITCCLQKGNFCKEIRCSLCIYFPPCLEIFRVLVLISVICPSGVHTDNRFGGYDFPLVIGAKDSSLDYFWLSPYPETYRQLCTSL